MVTNSAVVSVRLAGSLPNEESTDLRSIYRGIGPLRIHTPYSLQSGIGKRFPSPGPVKVSTNRR